MKASQISSVVEELIKKRLPIFIWGPPGIGKSSVVKEIAVRRELAFIDLRLSLLDPTDLKGIPFFEAETREGVWAKPSFLPREDDTREGILFLDEINTAPPAVQASAYQLILDRKVGEYTLPAGWSIVAAGNRENDRGVVYKMPPPLANRFVHFEMEVDFADWKRWAYGAGIESSIIAYLEYDRQMLFTFDPTSHAKAFATPRSWEYVDSIVKSAIAEELHLDVISGAVGREAAIGYLSYRKVMDELPDLHAIAAGSFTGEIGSADPRLMTALSIGLVNIMRERKDDREAVANILEFSLTLPGEYSIMLIRDLQHSGIAIEKSPNWKQWIEKFSYLLG